MITAICPGSFDPITLGHLNIIRRASRTFDKVVVCILNNASKTSTMFSVEERLDMITRSVARFPNVSVDYYSGLLAEYTLKFEHAVIVKGLRAASDFEYEFQMDLVNKRINRNLETLFIPSSEKYTFLSSSVVREMSKYGADLTGLVPNEIISDIEKKAEKWRNNNG